MKDKIEEKLKEVMPDVFFGGGRFKDRESWDCLVFGRRRIKNLDTSNSRVWWVAIVCEECIPENMENDVITKMREAGLKRTKTDAEYGYTDKNGECIIEMCTLEFFKSEKGCV